MELTGTGVFVLRFEYYPDAPRAFTVRGCLVRPLLVVATSGYRLSSSLACACSKKAVESSRSVTPARQVARMMARVVRPGRPLRPGPRSPPLISGPASRSR